jgi:hypothetical protein
MWIKYREKWSHGLSSWEYEFVLGDMSFSDYKEFKKIEVDEEYSWAEHYRGVEIEEVDVPPAEIVAKEIARVKSIIKGYESRLKSLNDFAFNKKIVLEE